VSETSTGAAPPPLFPPGRYGRRRAPDGRLTRRLPVLLTVAGAIFGLLLTILLYSRHGTAEYRTRVMSFQLAEDHATVTFEVFKPADSDAVCRVRARSASGVEVGAADVPVGAGDHVVITYTLPTTDKPVSAEVPRCGPTPRR
jgi:hypothetical protein